MPTESPAPKLWTKNFFVLWQSQIVSAFGDTIYNLALGFWILSATGSTILMGTLMAASTLPQVLIAPFAGVLVDRSDRRMLLFFMDLIRGLAVVFVGIAAFMGFLEVWMVFVCGIVIGICAAVFNPTVSSILPDIIAKERLLQGNSAFNVLYGVADVIGNAIGGVLYTIFGATFLFLFNGISYVFSAFTNLLIRVPTVVHEKQNFHFWTDFKDGISFVKENPALKKLMFIVAALNFFLVMASVLVIPYFERHPIYDSTHYGIAMAILTIGGILGLVIFAIIKVPNNRKFSIFVVMAITFSLARTFTLSIDNLVAIYIFLFIIGFTVSVINTFISSTTQHIVPQDKRGKVFALVGTIGSVMTPLGMALGGILASYFTIESLVLITGLLVALSFIPLLIDPKIREFINFDTELAE